VDFSLKGAWRQRGRRTFPADAGLARFTVPDYDGV